ncbi:MAG: HNH endonuclease [Leptospirales bacterium]
MPLEIDHIHPKSRGGSDRVANLTLACPACNRTKGNRDASDFLAEMRNFTQADPLDFKSLTPCQSET